MFNIGNKKRISFQLGGTTKNSKKNSKFTLADSISKKDAKNTKKVNSPLFGEMTVPDRRNFLGMSKKMKFRFFSMIIALVILAILISDDLAGNFFKTKDSLQKNRDISNLENSQIYDDDSVRNVGDFSLVPTDSMPYDEDSDLELASIPAKTKGMENPVKADESTELPEDKPLLENSDKNIDNLDEADNSTDLPGLPFSGDEPELPGVDENSELKPRIPLDMDVLSSSKFDFMDLTKFWSPELHKTILNTTSKLSEEKIKDLSNGCKKTVTEKEILSVWYKSYNGSKYLKELCGRVFDVDATIYKLEKKPLSFFNLEDSGLMVDGKPATHLWIGILTFNYIEKIYKDNRGYADYDKNAYVIFTALQLPEWISAERVYSDKDLPLRAKVYGSFFRASDFDINTIESKKPQIYTLPHIVLAHAEQLESVKPVLNQEFLSRIYDDTNLAMQDLPIVALENILYYFKHMNEAEKAEFEKNYDKTIGYHDVRLNPNIFREKPLPIRFRGQISQLGDDPLSPLIHYKNLDPNLYNIREFYTGAMKILDNIGKQQYIIFDTQKVFVLNPHTNKLVPQGTRICPETGKKIPKPYLYAGDEVMITGYMLFNWQYTAKNNKAVISPRIVVVNVKELREPEDPIADYKWIFVIGLVAVSFLVIFLVKKERKSATEFRLKFMKSHANKINEHGKAMNRRNILKTDKATKESDDAVKSDDKTDAPTDNEAEKNEDSDKKADLLSDKEPDKPKNSE